MTTIFPFNRENSREQYNFAPSKIMFMKNAFSRIFILILIPFLFSFSSDKEKPLKIALSKASPNYINWIGLGDPSILVIDLSSMTPDQAELELQDCDGLILTGGGDIDPSMYKKPGDNDECTDIDRARDMLEKKMTGKAMVLKIPILGICRGEQMLNVLAGGTLITDIPLYKKMKEQERSSAQARNTGMEKAVEADFGKVKKDTSSVTHQCEDYLHCNHTVWLESSSMLHNIIGADTGTVTTNHHQAVLLLGNGLRKNAVSGDGIIEGVEWKDPSGRSFMLGVQWHPERMELSNPFSGRILRRFLDEVKRYSTTLKNGK